MDWVPFGLLCAMGVFAVGVPLVRLAVRHGRFGLAPIRDPIHGAMTVSLVGAVAVLAATTAAHGWGVPVGSWGPSVPVRGLGIALGVSGIGAMMLAQAQMGASWRIGIVDEATGLVTGGLFAWIRHPIYTALLLVVLGTVLALPAPWTVVAGLWTASLVAIQARLEEAFLLGRHGDDYRRWGARTGRFVPGLGRLG